MNDRNYSIIVDSISKVYRINLKKNVQNSLLGAALNFAKSPITNFKKYRSLYNFNDLYPDANFDSDVDSSDILWALKDVSLKVKKGETIGIIGKNGAGKSTFLKVLCRITDPTRGRAEIRGRVSSLLEVGTGFHPELTGRENVYLNGTILGMKKAEIDQKFDEIIDFSGVEKFMDTPVKRYSSGMKVRLAFSVAAHLEPEVLIVDEVLAVGDLEFQQKCLNTMNNIGQEGRTVLFVSHNMQAINRLCSRAIRIHEGKIIEDGPSYEVVSNYLKSEQSMLSHRQWADDEGIPGGDIARLISVQVQTMSGDICDSFDIRHPFEVKMEYDLLQSDYEILPHFRFLNSNDVVVFETLENDPAWIRKKRPKGRYISKVRIPPNIMAEGNFFISCHLITLNPVKIQFSEQKTIAVNIYDLIEGDSARGDWTGRMSGVMRPLLDWKTELLAN